MRFVGDPATRIAEDHLRLLRFFRFHAWYGEGEPDADSARRLRFGRLHTMLDAFRRAGARPRC